MNMNPVVGSDSRERGEGGEENGTEDFSALPLSCSPLRSQ